MIPIRGIVSLVSFVVSFALIILAFGTDDSEFVPVKITLAVLWSAGLIGCFIWDSIRDVRERRGHR